MRCTGECCARIVLSSRVDGAVIYLTRVEQLDDEQLRELMHCERVEPVDELSGAPAYGVFTCRAFDTSSRRCTIYATRPLLCRVFPDNVDGGCEFCGAQSHADATSDA